MPNKPDPEELKALLTRIMTKKPEPVDPPESQGQDRERVIEADKILLRDGSGKSRGKISANADGSAGLILSDSEGSAWAWLGVNRDGEAFLELKDKKGEISFKVPAGTATPGALVQPVTLSRVVVPEAAPQPQDSPSALRQPATPDVEAAAGSGPDRGQSPAASAPGIKPGYVDIELYDRLEALEQQNRGRGFFRTAFLGLLVVILGIQAFLLFRPQSPQGPLEVTSLVVRNQDGVIRAWLGEKDGNLALNLRDAQGKMRAALELAADGSPGLLLYDQGQRVRAGLHLWPNGDPRLDLRNLSSLSGETERHTDHDSDNQQGRAVSEPGDEDGTMGSPVASSAAVSQEREVAVETVYVGSKTSNKYHYPSCKWAKTIKRANLIKFKSGKEAQERGYIPCPVCQTPSLSK